MNRLDHLRNLGLEKEISDKEIENSVLIRVIEYVLGKLECEHCKELLSSVENHWCQRCGNETDKLILKEQYRGGAERQLCEFCAEHD